VSCSAARAARAPRPPRGARRPRSFAAAPSRAPLSRCRRATLAVPHALRAVVALAVSLAVLGRSHTDLLAGPRRAGSAARGWHVVWTSLWLPD
jgi:hypothetical protein